jgi:putative endonuclease
MTAAVLGRVDNLEPSCHPGSPTGGTGMKFSYVYIVTNKPRGVLYIGVMSDLVRRISEHRQSLIPGFSKRYNLVRLVWYEVHEDITVAIQREKSLKRWYRDWKIALVEESNPEWRDLFFEMSGLSP